MIQYKLHFSSSTIPPQCTSAPLTIGFNEGKAKALHNGTYEELALIEVFASEQDSLFTIEGVELSAVLTDPGQGILLQESHPGDGPGQFLSWKRETDQNTGEKRLKLNFAAPKVYGREHMWWFTDTSTPPPLHIKIKVKRQEVPNTGSCSGWGPILPNSVLDLWGQ